VEENMEKKRQIVLIVSIVMLVAAIVMLVTLAVLSSFRDENAKSNQSINEKMSDMIDKNQEEIDRLKNAGATTPEELTKKITDVVVKTVNENTGSSQTDVEVSVNENELAEKISAVVEKAIEEATKDAVKEVSAEDISLAIRTAVQSTGTVTYKQVDRIVANAVSRLTYNIAKKSEVRELSDEISSLSEKLKQLINGEEETTLD
jgi:preprotein translocase subunit SecF